MARTVGIATAAFLLLYALASVITGQPELLRMRVVLTVLVPFVIVVVVREFVSRRALSRTGAHRATTKALVPPSPNQAFKIVEPEEDDVDRSPRQRTALVVDDEESNAALVRRVLAGAGYDVESTTLSRRALAMIERTAYDAVICDVKMPELSGQELYGRACQIRPEMAKRFVFITGDIEGDDTLQFLTATRCSYFFKPFNVEQLTAAVDTLTGARSFDTMSEGRRLKAEG